MDFENMTSQELQSSFQEGKNPLIYIPYAEALRRENKLSQALEVCLNGLKNDSYSVTGRTLLSKIYYDMGHYQTAFKELKKVLKLEPDAFKPNLMLLKILLKKKEFQEAQDVISRLDNMKPNDEEVKTLKLELNKYINIEQSLTPAKKSDKIREGIIQNKKNTQDVRIDTQTKIKELKEKLKDYKEIINFQIVPIEEVDQDLDLIGAHAQIADFFNRVKDFMGRMGLGELIKGFIDLKEKYLLFHCINSHLLIIFTKSTAKLGKIRKEIEQALAR